MKTTLLCIALTTSIALTAEAQPRGTAGIVYGKEHAFSVQAPPGWVLDNKAGRSQGLHACFYEEGRSWASAETVMYANTASKRVQGQRTMEELMAYDVAQFRKRAPGLDVTPPVSMKTSTGTASVRLFKGDEHVNHEAVAYIDEKHTIVMLVLSARTEAGFRKAYPSFEKLVSTYKFLTANVRENDALPVP